MASEAAAQIAEQMTAPTQEVTSEVQPTIESPKTTPANDRVSSKFDVLIKREQAAVQKERQAKEQMAQAQAMLDKIKEFESAKSDPKKAMELLGLNYDELTKSLLADGTIPPEVEIKRLRDEFGTYREAQEEAKRQQAEAAKAQALAQESQAVTNFKTEIKNHVNENPARYELINFDGREEEVYDLIDAHYNRTGEVMKIDKAADKIEEYYEKREVEKKKLTKLQSLWGAVPQKTLTQVLKQEKSPSQKQTTLTNQMSATPSKLGPRPSEERRVAEIVAKFIASKRT